MDGLSLAQMMESGLVEETNEVEEVEQEEVEQEQVEQEEASTEDEEPEQEEEVVQTNPEVEKASADGWVPKDDWVEQGKDPDDWVSAKKFNERGSMIGQIKALQKQADENTKSFEERLDKVNKFHEAQLEVKLNELKEQRRDAIEQADVEAVEEYDAQIENLKSGDGDKEPEVKEDKPTADGFSDAEVQSIQAWNDANDWVMNEEDPRTPYAKSRFGTHLQSGKTVEESIALVSQDISKAFPKTNPQRDLAPKVESGQSKPGQKKQQKLQWSDLSREEEKMYKSMPTAFGSKKEFLQTVEDIRKEG